MFQRPVRIALSLFLLAFLAHAPALMGAFGGALPSGGDTLGAFSPWHAFTRRELASSGAIPLWNPHLLCGVPFVGNGQSALFYPPTYLHFLWPEAFALWFSAFAHSGFFMLGGYFLGRTLGLSRRAAWLVGALLGLGAATPAHLFGGHLTFLPARSFWPWQAVFLLRMLRERDSKAGFQNAILWAACLALGLAAGAPQIWIFGLLFNLAIFGSWSWRELRNRRLWTNLPLKSGALALILTALWCAPTLLPLRELKSWSSHGDLLSFAEVTDLGATPRSLFRLLFDGFFGGNGFGMWSLPSNPGEDGAGIGLAGAILALAAPFFAMRKRLTWALTLGCALTLILALGSATPLYGALYDHVFLFRIMRVPARWLELWAFGAALLAGFCCDGWLRNSLVSQKMKAIWTASALGCLALLLGVQISDTPWRFGAGIAVRALQLAPDQIPVLMRELRLEALISVAIAAAISMLLAFFWRRGLREPRTGALVVALLLGEPLFNFWLSVRIAPAENVRNAQIPAAFARRQNSGQRWIVRAPFQQLNAPFSAGLDSLGGYEPFGSAPFFELARAADSKARFSADFQPQKMNPLWRVAGVSALLWKPKFPGDTPRGFPGKLLAQSGEWRLNSLEDGLKPWPRAYLTRDLVRADGDAALAALQKMAAVPFTSAPPAVISRDSPPFFVAPLQSAPPSKPGFSPLRAEIRSPDLRTWQVSATRPSFFVESETMAPGWKAYVDGKPAEITRANAIFRGVMVPPNSQKIALVYDSQTLRFALFLALCGFGLAAAWGIRAFSSDTKRGCVKAQENP